MTVSDLKAKLIIKIRNYIQLFCYNILELKKTLLYVVKLS